MRLHNLNDRVKTGITSWGCMWERGKCTADTEYLVKNEDGSTRKLQSRVTAFWPDGSVKWTAHAADAGKLSDVAEVVAVDGAVGAGGSRRDAEPVVMERIRNLYGRQEAEFAGSGDAGQDDGISIKKEGRRFIITAGELTAVIPENGKWLFERLEIGGTLRAECAGPVLVLEKNVNAHGQAARMDREYEGQVKNVMLEESGPVRAVVKFEGIHVSADGEEKLPFVIRMMIGMGSRKLDFVHTFLYDGDEEQDFLKGIGLRMSVPMQDEMYNRHVRIQGDHGVFHEAAAELLTWRPRVPERVYRDQMAGKRLVLESEEKETVDQVLKDMPFWDTYDLCQDSPTHFRIRKKTEGQNCCYLDCLHGVRTEGAAAFGSGDMSVGFSIRDFWQTYPSGYTFRGLTKEKAEAYVWLYSPSAEPMDFRHYAERGYNQVYYEGYDYKGATPYGIASTSEYSVEFYDGMIPEKDTLMALSRGVNHPAQYVGTPEFYHEMRAFGYWSLPGKNSEMEAWLEEQLDRAVKFYEDEVGQRNWYGLFNYGDFMHTYDPERHVWRYDMGGYAWDNTELVPTLWLWLMFMRTGRPDIFALAEKLTRHASEVDVYHMGKYKGLGSRHNVRHWGCPCKEARIAMAAHHRFYYYMTGDHRLEDIFGELKDNEKTFLNKDPLGDFYDKAEMVYKSHARSGPDWSSLCANWMTQWERANDPVYRDKIVTGVEDIKKAPLKLVSGPDFEFDSETVHLRYIGERAAGGTHLQICMGAPQVWMEMADLLEDAEWKQMLAEYGRFYYLSREEQLKESGGIIGEREFSLPFMAAAMGAYGAAHLGDTSLARITWGHLLHAILREGSHEGFEAVVLEEEGNQAQLTEIPWITTNFTAQWCLNVIMCLEFIREDLPKTLEEADALVAGMPAEGFRKA